MTIPTWNEKTQQWDPVPVQEPQLNGEDVLQQKELWSEPGSYTPTDPDNRPWPTIKRPDYTISSGVEPKVGFDLTAEGDRLLVEEMFRRFLHAIPNEDADRDGLAETPTRMANAYMNELLAGYTQDPNDYMKLFEHVQGGGLVIVKDIPVFSLCEHHMLPFIGRAHIAYIPGEKILGLSKFARIVDVFARRLQVQERLTSQIAESLSAGLDARGIMVILECEHLCMSMRGAQAPGTLTITSEIRGLFRDVPALREEALSLIRTAK